MSKFVGSNLRIFVKTFGLALAIGAVAVGGSGCSDSGNNPADGGVNKDGSGTKDSGTKPPPLTCSGNCKDMVMSKLLLPANPTQAQQYGIDFDNNGSPDNALGAILSALTTVSKDLQLQPSVDAALDKGETIILLRLQASDWSNDPAAAAQAWVGDKATCCPTDATDPVKCAAESKTTCYKGDFEFAVKSDSPKDATFNGKITGGALQFGPSSLQLALPLTSAGTISLNLQAAQIKGKLSGNDITDGVLAGAISKNDLDNSVLPAVANLLNQTLNDPNGTAQTKQQIKDLFDKNKDNQITVDEVKSNDLITTFLAGDVDIDNDGTPELSLGVGFSTVGAKIKGN